MASEQGSNSRLVLAAHYNSASDTQTLEEPLIPLTNTEPKDKAAHLRNLHLSTKRLQEQINNFLTAKMEEERQQSTMRSARDQEEEANYGEEKAEED